MRSNDGDEWRPILEIDGVVVPADTGMTLTPNGWRRPTPVFCRNGHRFIGGRCLVGFVHCASAHVADSGHGHLSYLCLICHDIVLLPPEADTCDHRKRDGRPTPPKLDRRPGGTGTAAAASDQA